MNKIISRFIAILLILTAVFIFLVNQKSPINSIHVQHNTSTAQLNQLGVYQWSTWEKAQSEFI